MSGPVTVTQADRTAAELVLETLLLATEPSMLSPDEADDIIGHAFARHREAAEAASKATVAELVEALERCAKASDGWELDMCNLHAHRALAKHKTQADEGEA